MKKMKGDKEGALRGSVTVLLLVLLSTIMIVFLILFGKASLRTLKQAVIWNGDHAGKVVLSYYLPELKERYDLYGMWKEPDILEWRMRKYVEKNSPFRRQDDGNGLLHAKCEMIAADPSEYLLMDPVQIKNQIDDVMNQGAMIDLIQRTELIDRLKEILGWLGEGLDLHESREMLDVQRGNAEAETNPEQLDQTGELDKKKAQLKQEIQRQEEQGEKEIASIKIQDGKILTDPELIQRLPTRWTTSSAFQSSWEILKKDITRIDDVIRSSLYTDLYALHYFGNYVERQDGWFLCQMEYILQGELSDEKNFEKTKRELFFLRTLLNMVSVYRDDGLRQTIGTMAAAAAPIPYPAAFGALAAAFSAAEAGSDVKALMSGERIPLLQDGDQSWEKISYEDHLQILLLMRSQEVKVLRMMDLIQLDLQRTLGDSFTLNEVCSGYHWEIQAWIKAAAGKERLERFEGISRYGS